MSTSSEADLESSDAPFDEAQAVLTGEQDNPTNSGPGAAHPRDGSGVPHTPPVAAAPEDGIGVPHTPPTKARPNDGIGVPHTPPTE